MEQRDLAVEVREVEVPDLHLRVAREDAIHHPDHARVDVLAVEPVGVPIHARLEAEREIVTLVPAPVVRVRDERVRIEAVDEQRELVIAVEVEGAERAVHAPAAEPGRRRVEQRPRDGLVVDELEEPEEARPRFLALVVVVDGRRDRSDRLAAPRREKALHVGDPEVGILARVEEELALEEQRRHPVRIAAVDRPPGADEALASRGSESLLDLDVGADFAAPWRAHLAPSVRATIPSCLDADDPEAGIHARIQAGLAPKRSGGTPCGSALRGAFQARKRRR